MRRAPSWKQSSPRLATVRLLCAACIPSACPPALHECLQATSCDRVESACATRQDGVMGFSSVRMQICTWSNLHSSWLMASSWQCECWTLHT